MSFHNFRLIRKIGSPNRADLGLALSDCCISSKWSFNSVETKSSGIERAERNDHRSSRSRQ